MQVTPIQFVRAFIEARHILEVEMPELDPGVQEESANGVALIAGELKTLLLSNPKTRSRPADRQDARRNNSSSAVRLPLHVTDLCGPVPSASRLRVSWIYSEIRRVRPADPEPPPLRAIS